MVSSIIELRYQQVLSLIQNEYNFKKRIGIVLNYKIKNRKKIKLNIVHLVSYVEGHLETKLKQIQ